MTEKVGLAERHPRLVAGLWFATFIGFGSLLLSLVFSLLVTRRATSNPRFLLDMWLGFGPLLGAAAVAGGWLGAELVVREVAAGEAVRRGAWIGILSGVAQVLLGILLERALTFESIRPPRGWYTAAGLVVSVLLRAGWLIPIGALAGSCLVRVTRPGRSSESDGRAT